MLYVLIVCASISNFEPDSVKSFPVLDSLKLVQCLPNEYYCEKGDSIVQSIMRHGWDIYPALLEKIKDTTQTQIKIADFYYYTVSDVAIRLAYEMNKKMTPLEDVIDSKFYPDEDKSEVQFLIKYYELFFEGNPETTYQNRVKLYKILKNE